MRWFPILGAAGLLLLIPGRAAAWGPAAHLDLGLEALRDLTLLAPAVAALLARFRDDFLYGLLAADITIGKNLSPYQLHCHNWQVALPVLDLAEDDATRAFAWGYLSHLAADVVAHNYFVPYKTVEHFSRRGAAHTYWELRFDVHVPRDVWEEGRRLSTRAFTAHDRHLRRILTGPLFSFPINKHIFASMVQFTRLKRWRKLAESHSRRTRRVLTDEEWAEARRMSYERVLDMLQHGAQARCLQADPTGHRNLLIATGLRRRLRVLRRQGRLLEPEEAGRLFRPVFREAIEAKLDLPSLAELVDPEKPEVTRRRIRGLLSSPRPNRRRKPDLAERRQAAQAAASGAAPRRMADRIRARLHRLGLRTRRRD